MKKQNKLGEIFERNEKLLENWWKIEDFDKMKQEIWDILIGEIEEVKKEIINNCFPCTDNYRGACIDIIKILDIKKQKFIKQRGD